MPVNQFKILPPIIIYFNTKKKAKSLQINACYIIPGLFDQQLGDEFLSSLGDIIKHLILKVVVNMGYVGVCFLLGVPEEGRAPT